MPIEDFFFLVKQGGQKLFQLLLPEQLIYNLQSILAKPNPPPPMKMKEKFTNKLL